MRLRTLLADLFAAEESAEAYTLLQLETALQDWQEACDEAALEETLPLSVVGDHWLSQLDEGGLSQRFFAGAVTFATLMPMRAIPFRMVCLLGMNDGDYPRTRVPMDFDLMGHDYRPGDRSRREDDRYLFLEALLSARERLHLSWVGRSITDNSLRPPSVLVGQLRDHLAAGWRLAGYEGPAEKAGKALLSALTIEHRLQPFSPDYFPRDPNTSPWSTYAYEWRPDAAAPVQTPQSDAGFLLPPLALEEPLSIRDLADFLKAPVRTFFRQRLGVFFEAEDPASEDQEPFDLHALEEWQLRDELIRAQSFALDQGRAIDQARTDRLARIRRRGDLASGAFGDAIVEELEAPMDELFERYQGALARWPRLLEEEEIRFQAEISGQAQELADWLGGVRTDDDGLRGRVVLETSDLVKNNHYRGEVMIRHWVAHLAAHLAGEPITTLVISPVGQVELAPLTCDAAEAYLTELLAARDMGMRRPLPLAVKTAFGWLKGGDAYAAAKTYEGAYMQKGEIETDPYLARAFPDFAALSEGSEFALLAETLLRPLADAMPVGPNVPPRSSQRQAEGVMS
jgi:exodeoxyribonuclease V gamma subunit